jgi:hypothetical protein
LGIFVDLLVFIICLNSFCALTDITSDTSGLVAFGAVPGVVAAVAERFDAGVDGAEVFAGAGDGADRLDLVLVEDAAAHLDREDDLHLAALHQLGDLFELAALGVDIGDG